jgi:hypothetical protein
MEDSVLSFLKAEWKVSDAGSVHWASSLDLQTRNNITSDRPTVFNDFIATTSTKTFVIHDVLHCYGYYGKKNVPYNITVHMKSSPKFLLYISMSGLF